MVKDIQDASKLFEPIYDETNGGDGYDSLEVSPRLVDETIEKGIIVNASIHFNFDYFYSLYVDR
ncbi:hypothetical protein SAY86_032046 [Trapa natans]|uniref:Uncharacterized protein n=1 Tax=Trapa natans TaxID=22666 RepID=A0AAN7M4R1_TRANT|nr:hypothetical protein SAY86_032046 [Trapa natans]